MMSNFNTSFQKVSSLVRRAIGKKTLIVIGIINVGLVVHHFVRPAIKERIRNARSKEADYIYEMEYMQSQAK